MTKPFHFKEFTIHQDKTAMKIGTDAVLLGAWANLENYPDTILDIGSGTGIIALMLAQRSDAMSIDAVEIDEKAYEQAVENFEQSNWSDRLFCYHSSFENFADELLEDGEVYDLIVSNPPFYGEDYQSKDESRNKARFTAALSFENLIASTVKILSKTGSFSVIIPFKEEGSFIELAKRHQLYLNKRCWVKGNLTSVIKRSLLTFSFCQLELKEELLTIEIARHQYTKAYIQLTKAFYLKME